MSAHDSTTVRMMVRNVTKELPTEQNPQIPLNQQETQRYIVHFVKMNRWSREYQKEKGNVYAASRLYLSVKDSKELCTVCELLGIEINIIYYEKSLE